MNKLYQGDNLTILRDLPDASVDLICTDPPFNTGRDWVAFDDRWEGGLKGYLKFMEPRLIECRRVLKDTGSLYLHCDPTASHYLKVMLDSVFGIKQFRNEIVWCYSNCGRPKRFFPKKHDIIYLYTETDNAMWNGIKIPYSDKYIERSFKHTDENGRRYRKRTEGNIGRYYADIGMTPNDWWNDVPILNGELNKERLGYPTQKPVALYERMIKASSNQSDIVLDPFAGSGTTLDAAHTLGRQWIGIDVGDEAINVIQGRLRTRHGLEYDRDYQLHRQQDTP